jgi:protocatechuate 3,4-dioxygenase beta subunit
VSDDHYLPAGDGSESDADLTRVEGQADPAQGQVLELRGRVYGDDARAVAGSQLVIWQANTWGRYHHPDDDSPTPLDPGFQGWGRTLADADGRYAFRTVVPGPYPLDDRRWRAPHVNFRVRHPGYRGLSTQMFLPRHALNEEDPVFAALAPELRARITMRIAELGGDGEPETVHGRFDLVLARLRQG